MPLLHESLPSLPLDVPGCRTIPSREAMERRRLPGVVFLWTRADETAAYLEASRKIHSITVEVLPVDTEESARLAAQKMVSTAQDRDNVGFTSNMLVGDEYREWSRKPELLVEGFLESVNTELIMIEDFSTDGNSFGGGAGYWELMYRASILVHNALIDAQFERH